MPAHEVQTIKGSVDDHALREGLAWQRLLVFVLPRAKVDSVHRRASGGG